MISIGTILLGHEVSLTAEPYYTEVDVINFTGNL